MVAGQLQYLDHDTQEVYYVPSGTKVWLSWYGSSGYKYWSLSGSGDPWWYEILLTYIGGRPGWPGDLGSGSYLVNACVIIGDYTYAGSHSFYFNGYSDPPDVNFILYDQSAKGRKCKPCAIPRHKTAIPIKQK